MRKNPNVGAELRNSTTFRLISRIIPANFLRHYIYPVIAGRKSQTYDAKKFWESYHTSAEGGELSDGTTVCPEYDPLTVRYHYNTTENSVILCSDKHKVPPNRTVLDIGSGSGHWIKFYLDVLQAAQVAGVDLSESSVRELEARFQDNPKVRIFEGNISDPEFNLGEQFDIINAIGVMFHIVDDTQWKQAVKNLACHLKVDGLMIVGGQFGWVTRNVQFHSTDEYASWDKLMTMRSDLKLVNKRIRSLRFWKKTAREANLRVIAVQKTKQTGTIYTPENNILVLSHDNIRPS